MNTERTAHYMVTFASAGCLSDTDPITFDSLWSACEHVAVEYMWAYEQCDDPSDAAQEVIAYTGDIDEDATVERMHLASHVARHRGIDYPVRDSLYRWNVERIDD